MMDGSDPWIENPNHPHYEAAKRAVKHVFKTDPDMTRAGGTIPITLTLQQAATDANILLLPMRASDDGAHAQNEKFNIDNFITGVRYTLYSTFGFIRFYRIQNTLHLLLQTKLVGMYLHEIGQI